MQEKEHAPSRLAMLTNSADMQVVILLALLGGSALGVMFIGMGILLIPLALIGCYFSYRCFKKSA